MTGPTAARGFIRNIFTSQRRAQIEGQQAAIERSMAIIEFDLDGRILAANTRFLDTMGYQREEIVGRHHSIFVDPAERDAPDYRAFWSKLGRGEFDAGQYRRLAKGGREVWIQASYNPVLDRAGRPRRVIKFATDISAQKRREAEVEGRLRAIDSSMAVIEFALDGSILEANGNFLACLGYRRDEVVGRHHAMFVPAAERESAEYRAFWDKLRRGEFDRGQYRRIGKDGREVWIEASYNPILDPAGRPCKVVKLATDITAQRRRNADFESQLAAIGRVMAVIEFDLEGHILSANQNFLDCVGYRLEEIRGQHHRLFVAAEEAAQPAYAAFWKRLARGEADAGRYQRVGRDGRTLWLQASYNPILGSDGRPYKVVKYASDISAQMRLSQGLQQLVADIDRLGGEIHRSTAEISSGVADLSGRTESQAASLEETASSMEQLTAAVRQNAAHAQEANQLADQASEVARRGGTVVQSAVRTMAEIHTASRRIGDIIGVIDGIAFQTNILALNAAVEAARAGEMGRGFAVVASEVRLLAQRCAEAAKDIKSLIAESTGKVAEGSQRVDQAGQTMGDLLAAVLRVTELMREIASASAEQTAGIEQVNQTIVQMDQTTQQNAALVEQASAATRSLQEQAAAMAGRVSDFLADNRAS